LSSVKDVVSAATFVDALQRCPRVESVLVNSGGPGDEALRTGLTSAKSLKKLHLGGTYLSMENGVMPALTAGTGMMLRKLVLEGLGGASVDVGSIGDACLALEALAVSIVPDGQCLILDGQYEGCRFQRLRSLELWCGPSAVANTAPDAVLRQLLIPPRRLRHLLFQGVQAVTDDLLADVWAVNPTLDAANVVFDRCHGFTANSLWRLLELPNDLRILRCWHCKQVGQDDKNAIRDVIADNNLTLYWEWYPWTEETHHVDHDWREYEEGVQ